MQNQSNSNVISDTGRIANLVARDGTVLHTRAWSGDKGRPTVFIGHSQPTHSGHFTALAQSLNDRGWSVASGDLRAHGHSTGPGQPLVHLTSDIGWGALIDDMQDHLQHAFDGVPFEQRVVAAQNITALLTLEVLKREPRLARHLVLTLPANQPTVAMLARSFARARMKLKPVDEPDEQTHHHLYSFLGARLRQRRHLADVMSADTALVDCIVADPLGFPVPTLGYWAEVFSGMERAWNWPKDTAIDPDTRALLFYGEEDPLVANGKLVTPIRKWFQQAGLADVDVSVVVGGRTAILLDEATLGVSKYLIEWVEGDAPSTSGDAVADETFETISEKVLERFGRDEDGQPLDTDKLIALCYDAVDDETRWIEVLYRVALDMARSGGSDRDRIEATLHSLMPHWDRSYSINRRVLASTALGMVLQTVIERLDIGTALMSTQHKALHHNAAFEQVLRQACHKAGLTDGSDVDGNLEAVMDDEFRKQIANGQETSVLSIGGHPIGFYFRPDALKLVGGSDPAPAGLLVLRNQDGEASDEDTRISMLELSYGLTRQEASVALHITRGHAPAAVAERFDVSINTVRTHLKRTYEKMAVDGQTEMVARIMGGAIGWLAR
ncbi:serine aminopeptidase domain-containing protein [Ahrensia sp. R2A130]|uniref:serine aminopeptidase domain-containing protein n=1 Tax=Ahrensia sp. R2A130 TaxID=744979 RepID=UPI0018DD50F5|nr:alpha/beta hydrolase [Ahrensia sp. R2A130]